MKTRNTQESLKKQIKDINMKNNEIFSIIRLGTYALYEKSIVGVDIDCCNKYKQNLLQEAIAACKNDIAKDLINRNIDLNHRDSNGQTPLHYCAQYLNIEIARLLLSKSADINIEDAYGNNPDTVQNFV
jgi:ankyrin repeat protein